jgi:endonuclease/exonuclease/phosphatase family metal-dependent hydrolase
MLRNFQLQLLQYEILNHQLELFLAENSVPNQEIEFAIVGDFNCQPESDGLVPSASGLYELLQHGKLSASHPILEGNSNITIVFVFE